MAPARKPAKAPRKGPPKPPRPSRKKADAVRDLSPTAVRLTLPLRDRLDAIVARLNAEGAARGFATSRAALVVVAVEEYVTRQEAAQGAASP